MEPEIIFENDEPVKADKPVKKHSIKSKLFLGLFLVFLLAAFLIIRPAIIGYSVYGDVRKTGLPVGTYSLDYQKTAAELVDTKSQLEESLQQGIRITEEMGKAKDELSNLKKENDKNVGLIQEKMGQMGDMQLELEKAKNKVDRLTADYEDLVKNTARSICCKNKIDNENINFYEVQDDRIICKEDSGEELNCW